MNNTTDLVVGMVALNGGKLVSKIRLQKSFYLLEQCGLGSDLDFDYRYYGPFSEELARAADDAFDAGRMNLSERPGFYSVPYTVFETRENAPMQLGKIPASRARKLLKTMEQHSAVVLELAATMAFLRRDFPSDDPAKVVRQLKPLKATEVRLDAARQLLKQLGIEAATV